MLFIHNKECYTLTENEYSPINRMNWKFKVKNKHFGLKIRSALTIFFTYHSFKMLYDKLLFCNLRTGETDFSNFSFALNSFLCKNINFLHF